MAESTTTAHHIGANKWIRALNINLGSADKQLVDLVPGSSDECLPIARSNGFHFTLLLNTGAVTPEGATPGGVEEFEVIAATDADGTGAVVVKSSNLGGGATPNTIGDNLHLEVSVENIRESLAAATHVGVRVEVVTATDLVSITVIEDRIEKYGGLTADFVQ